MDGELIEKYWRIIARTRKSGRISQSVKEKMQERWREYNEDVAERALLTHITRYPDYKETYTLGIMRNMQAAKARGAQTGKPKNSFCRMMTRDYSQEEIDAFERELLGE